MKVRALILHAPGTNRDREAALAVQLAGGQPEVVHLNQLWQQERRLLDYGFLVLPGGFSYGDDLGAGTLWALALRQRLGEDLARFVAEGRPVLGICNGFQALVKAGLLGSEGRSPSDPAAKAATTKGAGPSTRQATLAPNRSARFECRWVHLRPEPGSRCLFIQGLEGLLYVPVAHGEGNLVFRDPAQLAAIQAAGLVALTYVDAQGNPTEYPGNPNGSLGGVAGICNAGGNVLGLMPHPEDHVFPYQHPRWARGERGGMGLALFANGVRAAGEQA